jgi:hypothetical protein
MKGKNTREGEGAQWAKNQKNVQKLKFSSEFIKLNFI